MKSIASFILVLLLSIIFLSGCSSNQPKLSVKIDSIGERENRINYVLKSGLKNVKIDDLQFKEYSKYIHRALEENGFKKTNGWNADVAIYLSYGISRPQKNTKSFSVPIWGKTGISSSTTYGNSQTYGTLRTYGNSGYYNANTMSNKTTYHTPNYGVTGYQSGTREYTTFTRYFELKAIGINQPDEDYPTLWITKVISTGSNNDLRRAFPILVGASKEYIGTNTSKQEEVIIYENDKRVLDVKGIISK